MKITSSEGQHKRLYPFEGFYNNIYPIRIAGLPFLDPARIPTSPPWGKTPLDCVSARKQTFLREKSMFLLGLISNLRFETNIFFSKIYVCSPKTNKQTSTLLKKSEWLTDCLPACLTELIRNKLFCILFGLTDLFFSLSVPTNRSQNSRLEENDWQKLIWHILWFGGSFFFTLRPN